VGATSVRITLKDSALGVLGLCSLGSGVFSASSTSFAALNPALSSQQSGLVVRGTPLDLPLEIKVFVKEYNGLVPGQKRVEISGLDMVDHRKRAISGETLNCSADSASHEILNLKPLEQKLRWICRAPSYQWIVGPEFGSVSPKGGFIQIGQKSFRGGLWLRTRGSSLRVYNRIPLDPYLAGIVNWEIQSDFPPEAVKAQIIAARSYALATLAERRKKGTDFDLHGTELDQVYQGSHIEDSASFRLVRETQGQVLMHLGNVLKAYYHSSNGGVSELPSAVWGSSTTLDERAFLARDSPADAALKSTRWSVTMTPKMGYRFGPIGELKDIRILERSAGRRVRRLRLTGTQGVRVFTGAEFRRALGSRWLKSTLFEIQRTQQGWVFSGQGWGHGVGLSQLGAKALAREGKDHRAILNFYYPYASVRSLPELLDSRSPSPVMAR
jgi:stage II sporulation protein D